MTLGDRVVVMKDGLIHQVATPFEVYERPVNRFVAGFVGTPPMNFLEGTIVRDGGRLAFDEGENRLQLTDMQREKLGGFIDRKIILGVRPEALQPAADASIPSILRVNVAVVEPLGDRMDLYASTTRHKHLTCRVDARTRIGEGDTVPLAVDMHRVHFFSAEPDGANLTLN